jgi:hypothetical protein
MVAPGKVTVRLASALGVQIPLRVCISGTVPLTVCVEPPDAVPVIVPEYRHAPPRKFLTRRLTTTVTVLVVRLVEMVIGLLYDAAVIVPLQPLVVKPVTEPVLPEVLALTLERLQKPSPIDDVVLNEPVPEVVL